MNPLKKEKKTTKSVACGPDTEPRTIALKLTRVGTTWLIPSEVARAAPRLWRQKKEEEERSYFWFRQTANLMEKHLNLKKCIGKLRRELNKNKADSRLLRRRRRNERR